MFSETVDQAIVERGPTHPARNRVYRHLVAVMDDEWRASPGFRRLCEAMPDLAPDLVDMALATLVRNGWVTRTRGRWLKDDSGRSYRSCDVYTVLADRLAEVLKPVAREVQS